MGEILDLGDAALSARFEAVLAEVVNFRPREPHHYPYLFGGEASIPFERIFAGVARSREAIGLAVGEGLCALEDRDLLMDLGYSKMTDYAREELGLPATTARDKARLTRELKTRPFLREAVRSGKLSPRHARELFPVAQGEAERQWVVLAGTLSVRELHRAVKRARGAEPGGEAAGSESGAATGGSRAAAEPSNAAPAPPASDEGECWRFPSIEVRPEYRIVVDEAMWLAEETLWRGAPRWQQVEAMSDEFLGGYAKLDEDEPEGVAGPAEEGIPPEDLEKALEIESDGWSWLEAVEPVAAPELWEMEPRALGRRLKDLVAKRSEWDEAFGVLARGFVTLRYARKLGFANLGHYLKERLGMSRRAVEQRVWLEKRMEALPQLRHALELGEVSYEKARLLAGVADFDSVNGWIRRAERMTCVELERAIAGIEDAQVCARGKFEVRMPEGVERRLEAALRVAAKAFGGPLEPGDCLVLVAAHFVKTWGPLLWGRGRPSRVQRRDGRWCTAPGCSRGSAQDHHVILRSHGGSDDPGNQTALCAPHHLRGVHGGRIRVSGTAPDRLVWELADGTPLGPGWRRDHP
jgi:hypothetical protein